MAETPPPFLFQTIEGELFYRHVLYSNRTKALIFRWNTRTSHYVVENNGVEVEVADWLAKAVEVYNSVQ
jgi:hypothetical protein